MKFLLALFLSLSIHAKQTICLNMIVKNESQIINECLQSVKPFIDYWVIVDTGSTDGTQRIIEECMQDIPGELHQSSWVNFEVNRNEALEYARHKGDYIFFIDADEILTAPKSYTLPYLTKDCYHVYVHENSIHSEYKRILFIKDDLDWIWKGAIHESIVTRGGKKTVDTLDKLIVISDTRKGARSQDPKKYLKDAEMLEKALESEPDDPRAVFYLAQSYLNAYEYPLALKNYEKRAQMGDWEEEVYFSLYMIGRLQQTMEMPPEAFINSYYKAYRYRPSRAEPLYYIAGQYMTENNLQGAYSLLKFALSIPRSEDAVYVYHWIYDWGFLLQLADCCLALGKNREALEAMEKLLTFPDLPDEFRQNIHKQMALFGRFSG